MRKKRRKYDFLFKIDLLLAVIIALILTVIVFLLCVEPQKANGEQEPVEQIESSEAITFAEPESETVQRVDAVEQVEFIYDENIPLSKDVQRSINEICDEYGICYELVLAIAEAESSFDPQAVNGNCIGLTQISTYWHDDRMERLGVTDLYDPVQNALVCVDYLSELFAEDDDIYLVLMKYNMKRSTAIRLHESGQYSYYATSVADRAEELERQHGKWKERR